MIMGQYGQRFGKYGMSRGLPIPEDRPSLPKFLADNGYTTGQIGKWDIGTKLQGPLQVGFNKVAKTPPKKKYTPQEIAKLPEGLKKLTAKKSSSKYFCINKAGETVGEEIDLVAEQRAAKQSLNERPLNGGKPLPENLVSALYRSPGSQ